MYNDRACLFGRDLTREVNIFHKALKDGSIATIFIFIFQKEPVFPF